MILLHPHTDPMQNCDAFVLSGPKIFLSTIFILKLLFLLVFSYILPFDLFDF
jgi:hypothetical protein